MQQTARPPLPPRLREDRQPSDAVPRLDARVEGASLGPLDLAGTVFELVDLSGCELSGTRLSSSSWLRCSLHDCRLTGCDVANVTLEQTGLRRVCIEGARLTGFTSGSTPHRDLTVGDCQAELSVWRQARLERAAFTGCRLGRSDWVGATLTEVTFTDCDLSGADLSQCRMRSVSFRGCRYDGIRGLDGLRGATVHVDDLLGLQTAMAAELGIRVQAEG